MAKLNDAVRVIEREYESCWEAGGDPGADIDPVVLVLRVIAQFGLPDEAYHTLMGASRACDQKYDALLDNSY